MFMKSATGVSVLKLYFFALTLWQNKLQCFSHGSYWNSLDKQARNNFIESNVLTYFVTALGMKKKIKHLTFNR